MTSKPKTKSPQPIRDLTLSGTPYEVGYQHGYFFRQEINVFLRDNLARINLLRTTPMSRRTAMQMAGRYARVIEHELPEIAEEIRGIAEGARIDYLEATVLQIRRELIHEDAESGECSSFAIEDDVGQPVLAQTVDLAGQMNELAVVLRIFPSHPDTPSVCMYTFLGLCGYLGFNSHGLAVCLNMVYSRGWRVGVPVYLLIRHLLSKRSIDEALAAIGRITRASSRHLLISDSSRTVSVEMTVENLETFQGLPLVHTNHYIHSTFAGSDRASQSALAASRQRLQRLKSLVASRTDPMMILRDHQPDSATICNHNLGKPWKSETVGGVIIHPMKDEMWVVFGHPCENQFIRYSLASTS